MILENGLPSHTYSLHSFTPTGQSGLGKSTLINSLFMTNIYEDSAYESSGSRMPKTTQVNLEYALWVWSQFYSCYIHR